MAGRLAPEMENKAAVAEGLTRLAVQLADQTPAFALHHTDRTPRRVQTSLRTRLIGTLPMLGLGSGLLGGVGVAAMNEGPKTATVQSAAAMGIRSQSIFEQPASVNPTTVQQDVLHVELVAATAPLATPVRADAPKQPQGDLTNAELAAAVKAGVLGWTNLGTESLTDANGTVVQPAKGEKPKTKPVSTIWDAYAKDLRHNLGRRAQNPQLNVTSRITVAATREAYANKTNPKDRHFSPNEMGDGTNYLVLSDQAQIVIAGLLRVDVKTLDANANIPDSVINVVKQLQAINKQRPETSKTRTAINEQNLLASDVVVTALTKLFAATANNTEVKNFIDQFLATIGNKKLSDKDFQAAVQTFLARKAVQTVLAA